MKQATQTALYGAIISATMQPLTYIMYEYFGGFGEFFNIIINIIHFLCALTLVNFFYKLNQKQNQKTDDDVAISNFKE